VIAALIASVATSSGLVILVVWLMAHLVDALNARRESEVDAVNASSETRAADAAADAAALFGRAESARANALEVELANADSDAIVRSDSSARDRVLSSWRKSATDSGIGVPAPPVSSPTSADSSPVVARSD
jgi:hypothetical protein